MAYRYLLRRDTGDRWATANPVLALGEPGYDETSHQMKMGDGVTAWASLPYATDVAGGAAAALAAAESYADGKTAGKAVIADVGTAGTATGDALRAAFGSPQDVGYDLILLLGQSNMVGQNSDADTPALDVTDPRVWAFPYSGAHARQVVLGLDPLAHQNTASGVGPGMPFARWYAASIPTNRKVLLVPAAYSGTPFEGPDGDGGSHSWKVSGPDNGNNLYLNALRHAQAALAAAGPHARIVAALWLQGESDGINNTPAATYQADLDALIARLRTDLALPNLPFLLGGMAPEAIGTAGPVYDIAQVHAATPARVPHTIYVPGPAGYANSPHYTAAGQRLLGRAIFQTWVDGAAAAYPASPAPIADSFTRSDSATTMGTTPTGAKTWTILSGIWGISSNQAYLATASGDGDIAVVDTGVADHFVEARIATLGASGNTAIAFRVTDSSHWMDLLVSAGGSSFQIIANNGGSLDFNPGLAGDTSFAVGDLIRVAVKGTAGTVYRNGAQVATFTASLTGTQVGFRADAGSVRYDDFAAGTA